MEVGVVVDDVVVDEGVEEDVGEVEVDEAVDEVEVAETTVIMMTMTIQVLDQENSYHLQIS